MAGITTALPSVALHLFPSGRLWGNPQYFAVFIVAGRME